MSVRGKAPEDFLQLAIETLRNELQPALPSDKRYTLAMLVNALEIARRDIMAADEALHMQTLDIFYEDGDGTMTQLAADIRKGTIDEASHPDLRKHLRALIVDELRVRNPRFMTSRGIKR